MALGALLLIAFGCQAVVTGVIPPYHGKLVYTPSFPVEEPYVPCAGGILIMGGLYLFYHLAKMPKEKQ